MARQWQWPSHPIQIYKALEMSTPIFTFNNIHFKINVALIGKPKMECPCRLVCWRSWCSWSIVFSESDEQTMFHPGCNASWHLLFVINNKCEWKHDISHWSGCWWVFGRPATSLSELKIQVHDRNMKGLLMQVIQPLNQISFNHRSWTLWNFIHTFLLA